MYDSPNYLTKGMLEKVFSEYTWPEPYTIGDDDCPFDGVPVIFPKCTIFIREGPDGDLDILFSHLQTNTAYSLSSFAAIHYVLRPEAMKNPDFKEPESFDTSYPFTSLQKVENGVRNVCIYLQAFLLPCIQGDFSWVDKYKKIIGR